MRKSTGITSMILVAAACGSLGLGCSNKGTPGSDGGAGSGGSGGGGGSGGSGGSGGGTDMGPSAGGFSCTTGTLFAGDPVYNGQPSDRPTSGTGIKADPPLLWTSLIFSGTWIYTHVEGEVWGADLSQATPTETLIAGKNDPATFSFNNGPCASARFAQIRGIDALPDGSLVVANQSANAILHITKPTDPANCNVDYWVGNATADADIDVATDGPGAGDMDGAGTMAMLKTPRALVADSSGNVYFFDSGNAKIKKVAADGMQTVTTLAPLPMNGPDKILNFTMLGGTLYGAGITPIAGYVFSVNTSTGAIANVVSGTGSLFPPLDDSSSVLTEGITNDGKNLIVAGSGYVWYVTLAGKVTQLAGMGETLDFPPMGYDPTMAQPALGLSIPDEPGSDEATSGSSYYVTYHDGAVYYRGYTQGTDYFVEKISCK